MSASSPEECYIERYGLEFPPGTSDLTIELYAFRVGRTPEQGGLGKAEHFWRIANALWNRPDLPAPLLIRHEEAERMIEYACKHQFLAVAGCSSSGKSHTFAAWALVNWLCAPADTQVAITSTTLQMARKRIWGSVITLWLAIQDLFPGKLRDSIGQINYVDPLSGQLIDKAGLALIAAEKKQDKDAVAKLVGIKQARVIVVADELPELSEGVLGAASNLISNPHFQLVGLGNPASRFDAFGVLAEPVDGYASINESFYEWKTKRGWAIRFNAELNPNVLSGETIYPWMLTREKIEAERAHLGENSVAFWRFYKGFWAPAGATDGIYSEAEITGSGADQKVVFREPPIRLLALDPAFTNGGDDCMAVEGFLGTSESGGFVLQFGETFLLSEDLTIKDVPRSHQIARQLRELCVTRGIDPYDVAIDSTGAGGPFCDVVADEWSDEFLRVPFGGKASSKQVSANDTRSGEEAFVNRVSELWAVGKEFLRTNQIKGITKDMAQQMCERRLQFRKGVSGVRTQVEPKSDYRNRVGSSPDLADAAFILLELVRERHGFVAVEIPTTIEGRAKSRVGSARANHEIEAIGNLCCDSPLGALIDEEF